MAYTTIDDPSAHFQIALYSGNGTTGQAITNDGNSDLQPDWIWFKRRDDTGHQRSFDSTRGVTKRFQLNEDNAEATNTGKLTSFDSDGFTLGTDSADIDINQSSSTMVAWQWKANGGTRTTNTESGNNPGGGYQANTTAGFSIVDYTGTGATGTMAHGLGAVPEMIFFKVVTGSAGNGNVYHKTITADKYLLVSTTAAATDSATRFNDTEPTSTVFTVNTSADVNGDGNTYIAYAFRSIQGYSKFGSYTGNGNADGPFVYTGFKPAWIMQKNTADSTNWNIHDNKRSTFNTVDDILMANANDAEGAVGGKSIDFLSNGFKLRGNDNETNDNADVHIYMAFAEHPFISSKGVPCTAR